MAVVIIKTKHSNHGFPISSSLNISEDRRVAYCYLVHSTMIPYSSSCLPYQQQPTLWLDFWLWQALFKQISKSSSKQQISSYFHMCMYTLFSLRAMRIVSPERTFYKNHLIWIQCKVSDNYVFISKFSVTAWWKEVLKFTQLMLGHTWEGLGRKCLSYHHQLHKSCHYWFSSPDVCVCVCERWSVTSP